MAFSEVGESLGAETLRRIIEGRTSIYEEFELGGRLGQGAFARVYSLQRVSTGEDDGLAVKVTDLRKPAKNDCSSLDHHRRKRADKEAFILQLFQSHMHVIQFRGHLVESGIHYILMEKCQHDFRQVLVQTPVNEAFYARAFTQILKALQVIHGLNVVHRDIKPDNFLVTEDFTVKLCDFGLAERLSCSWSKTSGSNGTPPYMSPEMVCGSGYNTKTDIWSFGVTAYLLLYGTFPYMPEKFDVNSIKFAICLGHPAPTFRPSHECGNVQVSQLAAQFLCLVLRRKPGHRPHAKDVLKHSWLAKASTTPESSLPSLQPMLSSAHHIGALNTKKLDVSTSDELDNYLEIQQDIHRRRKRDSVGSKKASNNSLMLGVVPHPRTSVPGTITASTFSNLDQLNTLHTEESVSSQPSSSSAR